MERVNKVLEHFKESENSESTTTTIEPSPVRGTSNEEYAVKSREDLLQIRSNNKSAFKYTVDGYADSVLTREQRESYEKNGFLVMRGLLKREECQYFYKRFEDLVHKPELRPSELIVMRDVGLAKKSQNKARNTDISNVTKLQQWSREPGLWKYAEHPLITKYVKAFCGGDLRAIHFMVINKPSDPGTLSSRHPIHQDQWYFPFGPSAHIVCSWTALEPVYRSNGCLSVVPGSHDNDKVGAGGRLISHENPKYGQWLGSANHSYHGIDVNDDQLKSIMRNRVHLEMDVGDTVFFHPLLLHASGANITQKSRRSISVHYASSTMCEYHDYEVTGQNAIARDILKLLKMKAKQSKIFSLDFAYEMIWAVKSRQVTGEEGNLGREGVARFLKKKEKAKKEREAKANK